MSFERFFAEIIGHCIARAEAVIGLLNLLTILEVVLVHTIKLAMLLPELGDDGEGILGVDCVV